MALYCRVTLKECVHEIVYLDDKSLCINNGNMIRSKKKSVICSGNMRFDPIGLSIPVYGAPLSTPPPPPRLVAKKKCF